MKAMYAQLQHTEDTLQTMFRVAAHTYEKMRMLTRAAIGGGLILLAAFSGLPLPVQGVLLLVGCWLVITPDFPADCRADRAVQARGGSLPRMTYTFEAREILVTEAHQQTRAKYDRLQRLVEDDRYLYLFLGKNSLCMVDKRAIDGGTAQELKDLLVQKTGLTWQRDRSLLSMNFYDLRQAIRDRRMG